MNSIRLSLQHVCIQEIMADREEIAKLKDQLEMKKTIIKKQTMEIETFKGICMYYS